MDTVSEILVLRGPSSKAPPNPKVTRIGSIIEAPIIVIVQAKQRGSDGEPCRIMTGKGGPGTCVFTGAGKKAKTIIVRCVDEMTFDESRNLVIFRKKVMASSEDPEDPYVLTSETLEVTLIDEKVPDTQKTAKSISKIAAETDAALIWGKRHCRADRIVRDVIRGIISLHGSGKIPATVYEEEGIEFKAPRIIATVNGDTIHANGPGVVLMPDNDEDKKSRAKISYAQRSIYTEINEMTGRVLFEKDVVMERSGRGMTIYGDTMEADLEQRPKSEGKVKKPEDDGKMGIGRQLRRAIVRGNVRVKQKSANGRRNATGIKGILDRKPVGDVITLFGSRERFADVYDNDGFRLISPKITILQQTGIITAIGPGEVHISSITTDLNQPLRKGVDKRVHTIVTYQKEMKYNELARKVKLQEKVRVRQENVQARSDYLEVRLMDDPVMSDAGKGTDRLKAKSMDAEGRVRFWRFQPARFKSQVDADPLDRPGKTIYTRSNKAFYDLIKNTVRLHGTPPRPQAIQQTLKYGDGGAKRSRVILTSGELLIDITRGDVTGNPQPRIRYLKAAGPLEFDDE